MAVLEKTDYRLALEDESRADHFFALVDLSDYLSLMNMLFTSISKKLDEECSITTLQYRILLRLLSAENGMSTSELANNFYIQASTISASTAKLADAGYVYRKDNPDDMRVINLMLTQKGVQLVSDADLCVGEFLQHYWKNLTANQLEVALRTSSNAAYFHNAQRIENDHCRLDTAFFDAVMISRTLISNALTRFGFRTPEFRVLLAARILGENTTASHIAKYLFLKNSDVTAPIKSLEFRGFISKERKNTNRRAKALLLTKRGRDQLESMLPCVYDEILEVCHSNDYQIESNLEAARTIIASERGAMIFASSIEAS